MKDASTVGADSVHAIFDRLASRGRVPEAHDLVGSFQIDVDDVGRWYVIVDREHVTVSQQPVEPACAIGCSAPDFVQLMEGRLNLLTGFLRGRIRISGDLTLGEAFDRLIPV